jgi:hypothetical protein
VRGTEEGAETSWPWAQEIHGRPFGLLRICRRGIAAELAEPLRIVGRKYLGIPLVYTGDYSMSVARVSISLFGVVAVSAAAIAGATIWLMLTDPVTVADAVNEGTVSPFVRALAGVLYDALKGILQYL